MAGLASVSKLRRLKSCTKDPESWQYEHCCLVIDGMKIKKAMDYDATSMEYTGSVDLGEGFSQTTDELATEALIFMAVGCKGNWKKTSAIF